jgi:hypothetical protein
LAQIDKFETKKISVVDKKSEEVVVDNFTVSEEEIDILSQTQAKPKSLKDFIKF